MHFFHREQNNYSEQEVLGTGRQISSPQQEDSRKTRVFGTRVWEGIFLLFFTLFLSLSQSGVAQSAKSGEEKASSCQDVLNQWEDQLQEKEPSRTRMEGMQQISSNITKIWFSFRLIDPTMALKSLQTDTADSAEEKPQADWTTRQWIQWQRNQEPFPLGKKYFYAIRFRSHGGQSSAMESLDGGTFVLYFQDICPTQAEPCLQMWNYQLGDKGLVRNSIRDITEFDTIVKPPLFRVSPTDASGKEIKSPVLKADSSQEYHLAVEFSLPYSSLWYMDHGFPFGNSMMKKTPAVLRNSTSLGTSFRLIPQASGAGLACTWKPKKESKQKT